jgi:hypothetical protein
MTLVIGGCSFTYNEEMTWVGKVAEQYNVVNVGSCAAGNDYIARSVLHELENHMRPTLICQWSGIHRRSYIINKESVFFNHFKRYDWPDWAGDYHNINSDAVQQDQFWIKTGGNNIGHSGSSDIIHKNFVEPYAKYFYNDEQALVETFENILRVQYYCKMNDIKSYMFWWKKELENYSLSKYSKELYDQVQKMDTVWLPNLGDWCVENTDLKQEDLDLGHHPTKAQHDQYANEILKIIND